ncbi:hypothetical protein ACFQ08_14615 [Streptosporangium algeriense]|uniref:Uncharacterized protein n=1 Tax=Streptosporangium algeriense TaxID=1682748 RepID=A0ABW3DPE6_9ACTN
MTDHREEIRRAYAETTDYHDRWMKLLHERTERERRVRRAAMNAAQRAALRLVGEALGETLAGVRQLATAAARLPDRPTAVEIENVRLLAAAYADRDLSARPDVAAVKKLLAQAGVAVQDALGQAGHWFNTCQRMQREWLASAEARQAFRDAGWKPPAPIPGIRDEYGEPIDRRKM